MCSKRNDLPSNATIMPFIGLTKRNPKYFWVGHFWSIYRVVYWIDIIFFIIYFIDLLNKAMTVISIQRTILKSGLACKIPFLSKNVNVKPTDIYNIIDRP